MANGSPLSKKIKQKGLEAENPGCCPGTACLRKVGGALGVGDGLANRPRASEGTFSSTNSP